MIKVATQRLIDSVWTVVYEEDLTRDEVVVLAYSRSLKTGYDEEREHPTVNMIEGRDRRLLAIKVDGVLLEVLNQKHIFDYEP